MKEYVRVPAAKLERYLEDGWEIVHRETYGFDSVGYLMIRTACPIHLACDRRSS